LASLNLINVSVILGPVKAKLTDKEGLYSLITATVPYNGYAVYGITASRSVPITVVSSTDTTNTVFNSELKFNDGDIYSLFLTGQIGNVETIMIKENIPAFSDSLCGVRFINLSYNSNPVNITLTTTPEVAEFSNLTYKQISDFKTYPALSTNVSYSFQVRDAVTSNLLASFTLPTPRFRAVTLTLTGVAGGSPALSVIRINHY